MIKVFWIFAALFVGAFLGSFFYPETIDKMGALGLVLLIVVIVAEMLHLARELKAAKSDLQLLAAEGERNCLKTAEFAANSGHTAV